MWETFKQLVPYYREPKMDETFGVETFMRTGVYLKVIIY